MAVSQDIAADYRVREAPLLLVHDTYNNKDCSSPASSTFFQVFPTTEFFMRFRTARSWILSVACVSEVVIGEYIVYSVDKIGCSGCIA
jgi:hypothetical protein